MMATHQMSDLEELYEAYIISNSPYKGNPKLQLLRSISKGMSTYME